MDKFQIGNQLYDSLVGHVPQNPNYATYCHREFSEIEMIVVHHTASDTYCRTAEELAADMGRADRKPPYPSIPYHVVIEQDGHVVVCQSLDTLSWHADGLPRREGVGINNWIGVGVVLIGDFTWHWPYRPQLASLRSLAAEIEYAMGKRLALVRHRDVAATQCPGDTSLGGWFDVILKGG